MLRPYQEDCLDAVLREYTAGVYQQLAVLATGAGKTVIAAQLPSRLASVLPKKMLFIAHRTELIAQAAEQLKRWNPTLKVGVEMADRHASPDDDVVVACVASIGQDNSTRMARLDWDNFDKIVIDEVHHVLGKTYLNVLEEAGALKPDSKKLLLGITATPKRKNATRAEKKAMTLLDDEEMISLKSVFKKIVHKYTIRQAIREGWLVPLKGFRVKTDTDLSEVKTTAGDYAQEELSEAVNTVSRNSIVVKAWMEYAERRNTLAFTVDIQHAKDLAKEFSNAGFKFEAIWGTDPERASKLERFKAGQLDGLCNCGVLIEGFDAWNVMCVLDAGPTKSSSKYTQKIGRGTRLEEGTGNLLDAIKAGTYLRKRDCYVIDVVDNNKRCSLVTLPSMLGLNPEFDLHGGSVTEAVDELEKIQEKYPDVNLEALTDLSKVKVFVESLDMFADPYTTEVKEFSTLAWMRIQDGAYVLTIPEEREVSDGKQYWDYKHEKLHITQNELDEFVLSITTVDSDKELRTFSTLQEAFLTADKTVQDCRASRLKLMQREAGWHGNLASDASKKYLRKLVGKKPFNYCTDPVGPKCSGIAGQICETCGKLQMNAGQCSIAINRMKNKPKENL